MVLVLEVRSTASPRTATMAIRGAPRMRMERIASHASSTFATGEYFVSCGRRSWSRTESEALPSSDTLKTRERRLSPVAVATDMVAMVVIGTTYTISGERVRP